MIVLLIGLIILTAYSFALGFRFGYAKREDRFQKEPITYAIGPEAAAWVDNSGHRTKIVIYNEDLVDLEFPITNTRRKK